MIDSQTFSATFPFAAAMPSWLEAMLGVALLFAIAVFVNWIVKQVILKFALQLLPKDGPTPAPIVARLANIVPALILARGVGLVVHLPAGLATAIHNVANAFIILTIILAMNAALNLANRLYQRRPDAAHRPIKGYVQVLKILLFLAGAVLVIAVVMEQSPLLLLSGLGALAAVLMLVFKDTILSLVASVQLTSNDMLRVGDWIEMPALNADGDVIDIALHTIKVQNFDKTITSIPTYRLISDSFKNWRGMQDVGVRRIKRSLFIDQSSIRFLGEEDELSVRRFALIDDYLIRKQGELAQSNDHLVEHGGDVVNGRRLTNIGTFRAYVIAYLRAQTRVSGDMALLVRQLQPTAQGLPLEIYCFTATTIWSEYETIQADIFDHLLAILPEFDLRLYQAPSGHDVQRMSLGENAKKLIGVGDG
ncbi:mechanosensitive ion channel (plasmid) [Sphingobium sp. WTD-1]|jgi:miniconductance mechanosensitive channel|uniref:Mechanosensing system component YbdG n=1 Tax=Sphingobium yanoikuyae TaxID=13690 RepID=A0A9X7UKC7_SPHYA|nr:MULTISPECIES: mechanosensitive ion channel domain-containing protein [Sphingomonadaceae]MAM83417.1 mechanosensitive ion channel protein MscS [Acidobacteriota bacterium]QNG49597.1 mechanosensitive ion channel family protein [Sphingobium yanoikuyae]RSU73232.1 mechanosensitive ion channel family protein [Sphingomonas koreensis]RSV35308.1 mechanosensitive ion channel family protein [Sphingomonas sp. ABOLE]RSV49910.1 mechanosensitive ion channel family protein [Sphingomonas koreensis]